MRDWRTATERCAKNSGRSTRLVFCIRAFHFLSDCTDLLGQRSIVNKSVCLPAYLQNYMSSLCQIFCACYLHHVCIDRSSICSFIWVWRRFPLKPFVPSVLWRCWLGGRNGIRPVKNWVVKCWHGYLSGARCRLAYGPADVTATHYLLLQ